MSNIERNFVQDNGTVKENISYNPKYVNSDNTDDYRRIGDIPVSGNYEPNLPYPLDARTLVPKVEYLTDTNWWRTAFGIDTVLYKGMLVTCIDTHKTYVYDGDTIKLTEVTTIHATDWKKQRIDKSLVKWPIDENEDEIIRIGADIISPYKNIEGLYITNNSNLKGPSFYISDSFISLGANLSVNTVDDQVYPFIPYNLITDDTNFIDTYSDKQTGIFIPTSLDEEIPMSIYSARGINIRGSLIGEGLINQIELDSDGNLTNFASTNLILNASANIIVNTDSSLDINVSKDLSANIDNNIIINAVGETTKFSGDRYLETSANLVNSSTFTLKTRTDVSINATGQVYVNYAAGVKIFGNTDDKSVLNITPNYVELKTSNNVSIYSKDSNIILSAKNGKARIDSSALDVSAKNLANIKAKEFLVNAGKFGFNYDTNATKYTKIDGSTGFLTLAAKGTNGESKIVLETGEPGSAGRIINITSNSINLNSDEGTTTIDTNNFYVLSADNRLISVEDGSVNIGLINTPVYINQMPFPSADAQTEGVLRLTKNRILRWSKDIGVHHANEQNSDENDIANAWVRLATITWEKNTEGTPKAQSEVIIMSISDNQNAEIFMVKVNCDGGTYTADVQRLSYFSDMSQYHEISVVKRTTGEYIDIFVKAFSNHFAWNALSYSSNCVITETLNLRYDRETTQPETITTVNYKETIFNPNDTSTKLTKNSLIIPWPSDNIDRNKSAFLRYTRAANGVGGKLDWGNLDNQLKDIANNDAGTKVYIIGTERTGAAVSTCNEFYNNVRVYIDQYCNIFATAFYATSDIRKKKDIKEIDVNKGLTLIPKEYRFIDSNKKAYGFIAQEVEDAGYADIVNIDKDTGDKTLDYNSAFAIALAQMQAKIKQLEDEIKELKNK